MAESNRVVSRLMLFILLFDCQEAFHCCLVVACSNRINMISIQCHRVGEWSAGKPEFEKVSIPVWGNLDRASSLYSLYRDGRHSCKFLACPNKSSNHYEKPSPVHISGLNIVKHT